MLRAAGVNMKQMVRAAGTPAILYGCETAELSDSALQSARSAVARAAAPQAGGKNADATLYALDRGSGTLDPAVDAHVQPLTHWATAWWEGWFSPESLTLAYRTAKRRLGARKSSIWAKVTGPAAATIASLGRLGWDWVSAWTDNMEAAWDFKLDSPAAVANAAKHSVRRWRLNRLVRSMPGLEPKYCDVGSPYCPEGTLLVDFAAPPGQVLCGRASDKKGVDWLPCWRGHLASAISGGQWPQARKAAVPSWGISDKRCQVCYEEVGTLEHRFRCAATRPAGGWPEPPPSASIALSGIGADRKRLLQTRAMLVLRVPRPPLHRAEWFTWVLEPPEYMGENCTWYLDGSMLDRG